MAAPTTRGHASRHASQARWNGDGGGGEGRSQDAGGRGDRATFAATVVSAGAPSAAAFASRSESWAVALVAATVVVAPTISPAAAASARVANAEGGSRT